jgi:hypothetical protein
MRRFPAVVATTALALVALAALLALTACDAGPTTSEQRDISSVDAIVMSGAGRLEIEQGASESLDVEGPQKAVDALRTTQEGSTLRIDYDPELLSGAWNAADDLIIRVTVRDLGRVELSGAGLVDVGELDVADFEIDVSGAGNVKMEGLTAESLTCSLSGAGGFEVAGEVTEQNVHLSGAGGYQAGELRSSRCTIEISGAGNAVVWVVDELDLKLSGAGNLEYFGNPRITQDVSGAGRIESRGVK